MKKEIKFSAKFDSAEFDRSIEQMQRKLKEMYAPSENMRNQQNWAGRMEQMGMGGVSRPTQEAYQRATMQSRREMDQFLATEVKRQDQLSKTIEGRIQKVKDLRKQQETLVKGSEEELRIKEKISRMEENNFRLREIERGRAQAINQTLDAREKLTPQGIKGIVEGYRTGGISGAASAGMDILKNMGPAGWAKMIAGVVTAGAVVAKGTAEVYNSYKNAPINTASNYGSAMSGIYGREVNNIYSGRSAIEMAFLPDKQRAWEMARQGMKGERTLNATNAVANPIMGAAGYGAAGAAAGAGIGAFFGGVGAVPGALIGGGLGMMYGAGKNMLGSGDPKASALTKGMFSDTHKAEYEAMMAREFASKYGEAVAGLRDQNPLKNAAAEQYNSNYMRYLDVQRSMGLDQTTFHGPGGFREGAINAGFTDDMAMNASSNILGAGGSTRMARDSAFALQAGRAFDQTNAAGVLGQLSGSMGSSETTKQAYVKMLAEGTRQGLDSSEYREESRKMMEVTASAIVKSGATSGTDIDRILNQMTGFLADKTGQGIQASKEAFEYYNQASSQTGGPRGVMRAAGMMRDEKLGKMDAMDMSALAQIPQDQLSDEHPTVQALARKYGMSPEELINRTQAVNRQSFFHRAGADQASKRAQDIKEQIAKLGSGPENDSRRKELEGQLQQAQDELAINTTLDNPGLSGRQTKSMVNYFSSAVGSDDANRALRETDIRDRMEKKDGTGRIEDTTVQTEAESSRFILENFNKFAKEFSASPEAVRQFNEQLARTVEILQKLPAGDRSKAMEQLGFGSSQTQPTSGKTSN